MDSAVDFHGSQPPGILITRVRGYNLVVTLLFGGRRGALNKALAAASGAHAGHRVLDIGCGPGHFAQVLAARVGPEGQIVGVDPSTPMIDYANRHAGKRPNCRFELGAAQSLTLPDAAFDVVTTTFAMHHIPEEQRGAAITHMFRVLRPGGRLLVADIYPTGRLLPAVLRGLMRLFSHHRPDHGTDHGTDPFDSLDVRRYSEELRDAGFTELAFTVVKPWTGYLTAVKPG